MFNRFDFVDLNIVGVLLNKEMYETFALAAKGDPLARVCPTS